MRYLIEKLLSMFISLFLIVTLTFFLMKIIPGDPFGEEQGLPKEIHEALKHHYGLDQPWFVQYQQYLATLLRGQLGPSFKYQDRTVNSIIKEGFPISALLGVEALIIALALGIFLGTLAAMKENQWLDHLILLFTTIGISIPSFILATFLQYLFAIKFHLFPLARWGTFSQTLLPSFALAILPMTFIARLIRSHLIEILQSDYIKTARAKGLSETKILFYHGFRNSLLPIVTYLGPLVANILVGSFIIEKIFSIPGLGQWFVNSVSNRDYSVMMGLTIFYSFILLLAIFLVDILYGFLDPRIRIKT